MENFSHSFNYCSFPFGLVNKMYCFCLFREKKWMKYTSRGSFFKNLFKFIFYLRIQNRLRWHFRGTVASKVPPPSALWPKKMNSWINKSKTLMMKKRSLFSNKSIGEFFHRSRFRNDDKVDDGATLNEISLSTISAITK